MPLEFFVTEPLETLIKKRAAFIVKHQQHRDPPSGMMAFTASGTAASLKAGTCWARITWGASILTP